METCDYKNQTRPYNHNSSKPLEITVISAEDLRINKRSITRNSFVTVRSDPYDGHTTAMDSDGSSFPTWNEKFSLDLGAHAAALTIEVHCKTTFGGTKVVGTASVPVADFSGGYVPESYLHFLSYRLRDSRGQKNGVINISVRTVVDTCSASASASASSAVERRPITPPPAVGFAVEDRNGNNNFIGGASGGVVTGIPVWCAYQGSF